MLGLMARLSRMVPLLLAMAVIAAVIYLVVTYRHSPARAKEVLITTFTWLCGAITVFFGLASLYALFENNSGVLDLAASCVAVGVVGLLVTRWCNHVFLKHNPHYKKKSQKATTKLRWPWER
ncbi:guanylate cyclase [Adlercreutzia sp. ZJ242]|uniref:guanylate cyclase n=1 Tax=Adlercreutzia sp. ZJ242 TaxID=2709409 RepID=UPI001F154E62|nr:guanylate cyclase [Adlercreutzia sp. ZJ242]